VVKNALSDASVFVYLAARFTVAALPMACFCRAEIRRLTRRQWNAGLRIGLLMFGGYVFQTAGIARTTPSKAAFITGFSVMLVPTFMAVFWRRRIGGWAWTGVIASVIGLYYLTVPKEGIADLNRGDMLVLGCAVLYALQIIFIEQYSSPDSAGAFSFVQVALVGVFCLAGIPLFAALRLETPRFHPTAGLVFAILVTGIFATAITYTLLVWGQSHTSATNTALILAAEPIFAAVTSYIVLHERLAPRALAGAALILAGILVAELKGSVHPPAPVA
jgi:drug/metabolite transporter (DMT)-like permease